MVWSNRQAFSQKTEVLYGFCFELDEATVEAPTAPVATVAITTPSDYQDTANKTPTIGGSATPGSTVTRFKAEMWLAISNPKSSCSP